MAQQFQEEGRRLREVRRGILTTFTYSRFSTAPWTPRRSRCPRTLFALARPSGCLSFSAVFLVKSDRRMRVRKKTKIVVFVTPGCHPSLSPLVVTPGCHFDKPILVGAQCDHDGFPHPPALSSRQKRAGSVRPGQRSPSGPLGDLRRKIPKTVTFRHFLSTG